MLNRPIRSALFMPASNKRAMEKAKSLPVDAVIFDLEDAVAPDEKASARAEACRSVNEDYGHRSVIIRTNALQSEWGRDDLKAALTAGPDAVLVPKVSLTGDIELLTRLIAESGSPSALWIMVETPLAILNVAEIASSAANPGSRLSCFVLGTNDLAKETGARLTPDRMSFLPWISQTVCAARAYGLDVLDGVFNDYSDNDGLARECRQGRDLGFDGKTLIHPAQIETCNTIFSPSAEEIDQAQRIVDAFNDPENSARNVLSIDGKMVERLHADMARKTLAIAAMMERDAPT